MTVVLALLCFCSTYLLWKLVQNQILQTRFYSSLAQMRRISHWKILYRAKASWTIARFRSREYDSSFEFSARKRWRSKRRSCKVNEKQWDGKIAIWLEELEWKLEEYAFWKLNIFSWILTWNLQRQEWTSSAKIIFFQSFSLWGGERVSE